MRKYLDVWDRYGDGPLGAALREVLEDEFEHEDATVAGDAERQINPERVRNIFLGFNDGLVEIVGAVSGYGVAFGSLTWNLRDLAVKGHLPRSETRRVKKVFADVPPGQAKKSGEQANTPAPPTVPPGQAKKAGSAKALPPGQAKKAAAPSP